MSDDRISAWDLLGIDPKARLSVRSSVEDEIRADEAAKVRAATARQIAGTREEWGWQGYSEQEPQRGMPLRNEATARSVVEAHPGTKLVRRLVGPWEELT